MLLLREAARHSNNHHWYLSQNPVSKGHGPSLFAIALQAGTECQSSCTCVVEQEQRSKNEVGVQLLQIQKGSL